MLIAREDFRTRPVRIHTSAPSFILPHEAFGGAHEAIGLPLNDFHTRPVRVYISALVFTLPLHTLRRRPRRLSHPPRLRLHFRTGVHTSPA